MEPNFPSIASQKEQSTNRIEISQALNGTRVHANSRQPQVREVLQLRQMSQIINQGARCKFDRFWKCQLDRMLASC